MTWKETLSGDYLVTLAENGRSMGTPLLVQVEEDKKDAIIEKLSSEYFTWGYEETAFNVIAITSLLEEQLKTLAQEDGVTSIEIECVGHALN
jgi:hypothetical protein